MAALCAGVLVALVPAAPTAQPIYRSVDAQGNVRYSAFPPPDTAGAPAALPGAAARLGPEPVREKPAGADEMLDLSGVRKLLPGLLGEVVTHLTRGGGELGERERSTVRSVAERTFESSRVYALVRDAYERHSARERRPGVAAWLRSPAGRRIVSLEIESARNADAATMSAFTARLQQRPPAPGRLELIERLDWVTGSSELSTDLVLAVQRGLALGLTRTLPREQRLRAGQLAEVEERRPQVLAAVREPMRLRLLYNFRDLTDDDLRHYIDFQGTPDARAHNRAVHRALLHALTLTAQHTGATLAQSLPRPLTKPPP